MFFSKHARKVIILALGLPSLSAPLCAKNSNELLYTEPFDLAAGGTTLTRASQEGIVFANPALLPLGGAWVRWLGFQAGFMIDRDLAQSAKDGSLTNATGTGDSDFVDQLFARSLHFGQTATLSFLNQNFAISAFDRVELDVEGQRFGDDGMPSINFGAEAYGGVLTSYALRPARWFSVGVTGKYLYASEPEIKVPITDQEKIKRLTDTTAIQSEATPGKGTGADLGMLFLWQGYHLDLSAGLKVEDIGGTHFTEEQKTMPQTYNIGLGLALHGTKEVLHLSVDYRDAGNAYDEKAFKKLYLGARLMIRNIFGIACGLYEGIPTAGVRMDLFLFKLGLTAYGRELGTYPGDRQRNMLMVYTSFGF